MSDVYTVPRVYITEETGLSFSIQSGETAVPLFVGVFNARAPKSHEELTSVPLVRVENWADFTSKFSTSDNFTLSIVGDSNVTLKITDYMGSHSVRLYFENGGGPCYVTNTNRQELETLSGGRLNLAAAVSASPEITLLCYCEFINRSIDDAVYGQLDLLLAPSAATGGNPGRFMLNDALVNADVDKPQSGWDFGAPTTQYFSQVATYFPGLATAYTRDVSMLDVGNLWVKGLNDDVVSKLSNSDKTVTKTYQIRDIYTAFGNQKQSLSEALKNINDNKVKEALTALAKTLKVTDSVSIASDYEHIRAQITQLFNSTTGVAPVYLRASVAMAGVYARVDRERGVWKAPANVALSGVNGLIAEGIGSDKHQWKMPVHVKIDDALNAKLVDKKINAIRTFRGQGVMVWGARTMSDSPDWRYIQVRRLFNTVERDARTALRVALFEPNTQATWETIHSALHSYLDALWRQGALQGDTAEQAYSVQIGLGTTMTKDDISNGKMIARIGLAAVRPAEFIVLELSQDVTPG